MPRLYTIPLNGLKEGHHTFKFEVDNEYFENFEESEIKEGNLTVIAEVEKRSSHLELEIIISGQVKICCDRCLEMFAFPIECRNSIIVKSGSGHDENDPDIIILALNEQELDLKQYIYEFIYLALPIKRVHPRGSDGKSTCDPEMIRKLNEHIVDEERINDPTWDELKKLINDN